MQSKEEKNRKAKIRQRKYRKTHKKQEREYNRTPKRANAIAKRVQARRDMKKAGRNVKGKDVHHKDGNTNNNKLSNLKAVKRYHDGGKKKGKK